ncbi:hypothetical protein D1BOALGB6SA_9862 [Olavius sp. associated proteobacterium Delta 1]|nr:hypothetical protein D1BOALGB6SA_9862 [Olavius sp. associated proteobacterium Delta 1]
MKILYISQYFPPEVGATQNRAYEMSTNLAALGHQVTMMTELPNHPSGIIFKGYRGRYRMEEAKDGIRICRSWVFASPKKNFITRILFYISFMATTIFNSLIFDRQKYDLIYATSPPLFVGVAGVILSKIRRIPFVFEVRDLWPESAIELGELNNPAIIRLAKSLENFCYRYARALIVVTKGIHDRLETRQVKSQNIFLIRNATNPEQFYYIRDEDLKDKLGWNGKFIVLYAGIHGIAQGLENIIDVAAMLRHNEAIHFVFIGEGPEKKAVQIYAAKHNLQNTEFLPEIKMSQISKYISLADLCLVPLKKKDLFKGALPSKIFDYWACGKPIVISVDGEARQEVETAQGGIFVEPENPDAMADAIKFLYHNPHEAKRMGDNGRDHIHHTECTRSEAAKKISLILERCCDVV